MRFDVISIFPEFFAALQLSLVGKAQEKGILDIGIHNLRDFTSDIHRTVDDTPCGGGAGMVMKADIWGKAIDSILAENSGDSVLAENSGLRPVLAIPTPGGKQLKQADCHRLAKSSQVIVACGRYEGIDARVAQYYRQNSQVEVFEYSLGDYVLNGGEVAAVALIEAVARLVPGMVGNPESLTEESYSAAGLLEYPVYTRPLEFRGLAVPEVLLSGNHQKVRQWRREQALRKTAQLRPDLIRTLAREQLEKDDLRQLAAAGWFLAADSEQYPHLQQIEFRPARLEEAKKLADFAAQTFPDACPPGMRPDSIASFIAENLSESCFRAYLNDETRRVLVACTDAGEITAYSLVIIPRAAGVANIEEGAPVDFVVDGIPREGPLLYLSKLYLGKPWRGSGLCQQFLKAVLADAAAQCREWPEPYIWLGTNQTNKRAQRAYKKVGFLLSGQRVFFVGDESNKDITMVRRLNMTN